METSMRKQIRDWKRRPKKEYGYGKLSSIIWFDIQPGQWRQDRQQFGWPALCLGLGGSFPANGNQVPFASVAQSSGKFKRSAINDPESEERWSSAADDTCTSRATARPRDAAMMHHPATGYDGRRTDACWFAYGTYGTCVQRGWLPVRPDC